MVDPSRRHHKIDRDYVDRTYRNFNPGDKQVAFSVTCKETDLYIKAQEDLSGQARAAVEDCRKVIEGYIKKRPEFRTSLTPLGLDPEAPPVVQAMLNSAELNNVGPMAAVAGAIAEQVGRALLPFSREVIVENGGDIYVAAENDVIVGIFAGPSALNMQLGLRLESTDTPCGICTSSATVGPSLSFGQADAVTVWASDTALADGAATAVANQIITVDDIKPTLEQAGKIPGIKGMLVILGERLGLWGSMNLVKLDN